MSAPTNMVAVDNASRNAARHERQLYLNKNDRRSFRRATIWFHVTMVSVMVGVPAAAIGVLWLANGRHF